MKSKLLLTLLACSVAGLAACGPLFGSAATPTPEPSSTPLPTPVVYTPTPIPDTPTPPPPTPTEVPPPTRVPPPVGPVVSPGYTCAGAPQTLLAVGSQVITNEQVKLRSDPSGESEANVLKLMPKGIIAKITDGPECWSYGVGSYIYWKVQFQSPLVSPRTGWLAEAQPGRVFLVPYAYASPTPN